ncbi:putative chemoreceptor glutamine deamidase CheD [Candidatus Sulfopaludibacter sp. SbA3]|nr:putative chemoreceptor glutamine deamidase CheD [Candidatus Sulfopaludibacter sp. SbA3]
MVEQQQAVVVGVADCYVTNQSNASLVTYALGSCIAVAIYDPLTRVGGLLHFMLPESSLSREKAEMNPYMFADSGVPLLFRRAYSAGAEKRRLVVRLAGGAQVMDNNGVFNIGKRNYLAVRKLLWQAGVLIHAESIGGNESRTVRLEVGTGRLLMRTSAGREELLERRNDGVLSTDR